MAALKIVFEAPDNLGGVCPSRERPVDLVHLEKQTMGDKALELDVLQLFARQARQCVKELGDGDRDLRISAAHKLKGAARAIGAFGVASAAEALEDNIDDAARVAAVGAAVIETENFILKLCR